jgi:ribosome biogenesis SPOUT family RNA methylase Rps3
MAFIIEHLEDGMHSWCQLEYKHMLTTVGADNLYFSGLSDECKTNMPAELKAAHCHSEDVLHIPGIKLEDVCLLDPAGKQELSPEDGDKFKYFLFGGILGDDPPQGKLRFDRSWRCLV